MELATRTSPDIQDTQFTPFVARYDKSGHPVINHQALVTLQQFFLTNVLLQTTSKRFVNALFSNMFENYTFYRRKSTHTLSEEDMMFGRISSYMLGIMMNDMVDNQDSWHFLWDEPSDESNPEVTSFIDDQKRTTFVRDLPIDESAIPKSLKVMRALMKEKLALLPQSHPLIYIEGGIKSRAFNENPASMSREQLDKQEIESAVEFCSKLLARLPTNGRFDAVRRELETTLSLAKNTDSPVIGKVVEGVYKALLYLLKETRRKELDNMSFVLSAEEPFEMLMKHLLERMPCKMDLDRR